MMFSMTIALRDERALAAAALLPLSAVALSLSPGRCSPQWQVVQDLMPVAPAPRALAWLQTDKAGLIAVALEDGTLGLADPLTFTLKRVDSPVFEDKINLESPVLALAAHGSLLAALQPMRLTVFETSALLSNRREFDVDTALACAFNPQNTDELLVLTATQLLLLNLSDNARRTLLTFPVPLLAGLVAFASGTSVVLATQVNLEGTVRLVDTTAPDTPAPWTTSVPPLNVMDYCAESALLACTTAEGSVLFIDTLNGLRHFNINSNDGHFLDARWLPFESQRFSALKSTFAAHLFELRRTSHGLAYHEIANVPKVTPADTKAHEPSLASGIYDTFPYAAPDDLVQLKKVSMEALMRGDEAAAKEFSRQMSRQSYAIVTLSEEQLRVIREAEEQLDAFYASSEENKDKIRIEMGRDVGYKFTPNVKEFFQMRKTDLPEFPWPEEPRDFARKVDLLWDTLDAMARRLMHALAIGLEIDPARFDALLDPVPQPSHTFSHTIMGAYNYFQHDESTETCLVHKDMGLISLIPHANIPGLECLDYNIQRWVKAEESYASDRNDMVVIGCQTLDRLTGSYYASNVHRVINSISRRSIVFKLRARSDAILDMKGLQSPVLESLFRYWPPPMRVDEWIIKELHYEDSVNFPGAALQNYKNCILDPSLNKSIVDKFGQGK